MNRPAKKQAGFTLLELLIASIVFAIMALMAYGGLDNVIDISQSSKQALERLKQVQQGVSIISRDFSQLTQRPVRDEFGNSRYPVMAGTDADLLVELSRGGRSNPAELLRSSLQRVAYRFEDNSLVRLHWKNLDRAQGEEPVETAILDKLDNVQIRFLDQDARWNEQWPPLNQQVSGAGETIADIPPPVAIEIILSLNDYGDIRRLYAISRPRAVITQ